jgi:hypothetical protein
MHPYIRYIGLVWLSVWFAFAIIAAMGMQRQMGLRIAPDAVLALMFAGTGLIPFAIPSQFSLRTLLIALTLIAVVLGLVMWAVETHD